MKLKIKLQASFWSLLTHQSLKLWTILKYTESLNSVFNYQSKDTLVVIQTV